MQRDQALVGLGRCRAPHADTPHVAQCNRLGLGCRRRRRRRRRVSIVVTPRERRVGTDVFVVIAVTVATVDEAHADNLGAAKAVALGKRHGA